MSIYSRMKAMLLQEKVKISGKYGEIEERWIPTRQIEVAIHEDERSVIVNNTKYVETYCTGITREVLDPNQHRLVDGNLIYSISSMVLGRYNKLTLKVVDTNGG